MKSAISKVTLNKQIMDILSRLLAGRLCEEVILYTPAVLGSLSSSGGKYDAPSTGALMNTFSDDAKAAKDKDTVDYSDDYDNYDYDYSSATERSLGLAIILLTIFSMYTCVE